jgi:small subunit ribosomal protein S20
MLQKREDEEDDKIDNIFWLPETFLYTARASSSSTFSCILPIHMPVIQSAKKALKQSEKRASRNRHFNELYKEALKSFERAINDGTIKTQWGELLSALYSRVDTLVKKNILHKNNAARRKSRFAKLLANAQ